MRAQIKPVLLGMLVGLLCTLTFYDGVTLSYQLLQFGIQASWVKNRWWINGLPLLIGIILSFFLLRSSMDPIKARNGIISALITSTVLHIVSIYLGKDGPTEQAWDAYVLAPLMGTSNFVMYWSVAGLPVYFWLTAQQWREKRRQKKPSGFIS